MYVPTSTITSMYVRTYTYMYVYIYAYKYSMLQKKGKVCNYNYAPVTVQCTVGAKKS